MSLKSKLNVLAWCLSHQKQARKILHKEFDKQQKINEKVETIRASSRFDGEWYLRNNIDLQNRGIDPAWHYLLYGGFEGRDPSPAFCSEEYLELHEDVAASGLNPLLHYMEHGTNENREISTLELKKVVFPNGAVEAERRYAPAPVLHRRVAILSCFIGSGRIPETLLYLIRALHEVADQILLVGDCLIFPEELDKLDGLVAYAKFERHEQYDFGSYRRGLSYAREAGFLDAEAADELIMLNDSCYGPVYPFSESFDRMSASLCDFWGYSDYKPVHEEHISTYFMVFRRSVIDSLLLDQFLSRVFGKYDRGRVIATLETQLTVFLRENGLYYDIMARGVKINLFNYPVTFLRDYRIPMVKKKAFARRTKEDIDEAFRIIQENAPELAKMIHYTPFEPREHRLPSQEEHQNSFADVCRRIAEKTGRGEKIKALFFVLSASMFPSKPLFDAMMEDELFDPYITVIPDTRWKRDPLGDMFRCERELLHAGLPEERLIRVRRDELGRWPDVCEGMDVVCYNTPYHLTSFRYEAHYTLGRSLLPIMVNYGFFRSKYDDRVLAMESFSYMWKAFFECPDSLAQYQKNSPYGGTNGEMIGYIKMDPLCEVIREEHERKRILIALHHSVEGGSNRFLNLANIARYGDYFLALPDRFPEIDFLFRPHPFTFRVLSNKKLWGPEKVEEFIAAMKSKPNVIWSEGADYFKEFADSDGCIQDCGSYLVEYLYTGKPCCYMLKSPSDIDAKFAPLGKKCLEHCYISYDTEAIDNFIRNVIIDGKDEKAEARERFAQEVMVNYPHAAQAALESIRRGIFAEEKQE